MVREEETSKEGGITNLGDPWACLIFASPLIAFSKTKDRDHLPRAGATRRQVRRDLPPKLTRHETTECVFASSENQSGNTRQAGVMWTDVARGMEGERSIPSLSLILLPPIVSSLSLSLSPSLPWIDRKGRTRPKQLGITHSTPFTNCKYRHADVVSGWLRFCLCMAKITNARK